MNLIPPPPFRKAPFYPESDGKPLADNTRQAQWIIVLFDNLTALFHTLSDVFIAADLLWYPVEGEVEVRNAPDVMLVFGRPKGHRGSYRQWDEANIPVTVAFEILSPGNDYMEMTDKFLFYEDHGVEEYYVYDPESNRLQIWLRKGDMLRPVRDVDGFASPRIGIRFDMSGPEMVVLGPDGKAFLSFQELRALQQKAEQQFETERKQRFAAEERLLRAEKAVERAEKRAARLAELSSKARKQQASPEELRELEQLEESSNTD
jgi:Uma2 family endonuclease